MIVGALPRTDGDAVGGVTCRLVAPNRGTVSSRLFAASAGCGDGSVSDTGGSGLFGCSSVYDRVIVGGSGAVTTAAAGSGGIVDVVRVDTIIAGASVGSVLSPCSSVGGGGS